MRSPAILRALSGLIVGLALLLGGTGSAGAQGYAVPIGGALSYDNDEVWSRLVALAGGRNARFVVFGTASENPEKAAARIVDALRHHGATVEVIPMAAPSPERASATHAQMKQWAAMVAQSRGVYFAGGAQERITAALAPGGKRTPVLEAIWDVYRRGGVVAGSSAGAAIMSEVMFRDAQDVMAVMKGQLKEGREIDRGLGFAGPRLFVDQHFLRRGRIGRMLPLMQAKSIELGLGVEENSAAIIHGDQIEIIGGKGAVLVDLSAATRDPAIGAFNLRNARLDYLERGDKVNLRTRVVTPSPIKQQGSRLDPAASDFEPYYKEGAFYPDFLGEGTLVTAMARLLDSPVPEIRGLAFNVAASSAGTQTTTVADDLGFEFRLYKDKDSRGWLSTAGGGEAYTLTNVRLDVMPVRMSNPLYAPWPAAAR